MNPQPFCFNRSQVKAIVLGVDPTNFSNKGERVELFYAFGIGQNPNYFRAILQNLNLLGLHLEDLYLTNLVTEYQGKETAKNRDYKETAWENIDNLNKEPKKVDGSRKLPVFLTAYQLYKVLLNDGEKILKAKVYIPEQADPLFLSS